MHINEPPTPNDQPLEFKPNLILAIARRSVRMLRYIFSPWLEIKHLRSYIDDLEYEKLELIDQASDLKVENQELQDEIKTSRSLVDEAGGAEMLYERWVAVRKDVVEERKALAKARGKDDKLISEFLPNLQLTRDSAECLLVARTRKPILSELRKLNDNPQAVRGEIVHNAKGWRELRPNYNQRIYYRKSSDNRTYEILIGNKNNQNKDIKWMKTN